MNKKYDINSIFELHSKFFSDKEISEKLNIKIDAVIRIRCKLGLKANNYNERYKYTNEELNIIIGTLLGDSCIRYVHSRCTYPSLTFTHCKEQEEWFIWKCKKLKNLISSYKDYVKKSFFTKENVTVFQCTGKNMKCLVNIRDDFYVNNIKIIPIEFIKENFNELSLYCLYMDDGSYDIKTNSYIINSQCFEKNDLINFISFIKEKFNLNFNIKSDNCLYLRHISNDNFEKLLLKFNECKSMEYKIGACRRKIPLNGVNPEVDDLPC